MMQIPRSTIISPTFGVCRPLSLPAAGLLLMTIGGCAALPAPKPEATKIPSDCDLNAQPVPYPPLVKNEDLGVRAARYAAALGQANGRLAAVRECDQKVRDAFAQGKE